MTLRERIDRASGPPEDSVAMRVVVAAAVEVAILAVVAQGGVNGSAAILPLTLAPVGYVAPAAAAVPAAAPGIVPFESALQPGEGEADRDRAAQDLVLDEPTTGTGATRGNGTHLLVLLPLPGWA